VSTTTPVSSTRCRQRAPVSLDSVIATIRQMGADAVEIQGDELRGLAVNSVEC
jgi:hypothetical protein